jgi:DNA processing protein
MAAKCVGVAGARRLLAGSGSVEDALDALSPGERREAESRAVALTEAAARAGIEILVAGDDRYPRRLNGLPDPPPVLFALGSTTRFAEPAVAIVGSRKSTAYGARITRRLAADLAARGVTIVSGLAFGIDGEAHVTTLDAGGHTIAVLGTGADVPYPRAHDRLHRRIAREGTIVSERAPGAAAHIGAFPRRNRMIAALADVTVVIEAGAKSGALITARIAGEIGRAVGAVPGPVDAATSEGSNGLLRDGAQVITSPDDVLGLLRLSPARVGEVPDPRDLRKAVTSSDERKLLEVLRAGPRMTDELVTASGLAPREVIAALTSLDLLGLVETSVGGLVAAR